MKKQIVNTAVALLLTLGVSACSVGNGSGSQGEAITRATTSTTTNSSTTTDSSADDTAAAEAAAKAAAEQAAEEQAAAEAKAQEEKEAAEKLAAEKAAAEAEAAKLAAEQAAAAEALAKAQAEQAAAEAAAKEAAAEAEVAAAEKAAQEAATAAQKLADELAAAEKAAAEAQTAEEKAAAEALAKKLAEEQAAAEAAAAKAAEELAKAKAAEEAAEEAAKKLAEEQAAAELAAKEAAEKEAAEKAAAEESAKKEAEEQAANNAEENTKDEETNDDTSEETSSTFAVTGVAGSQASKYLSSAAAQEELVSTIKTMSNVTSGTCSNASGSACSAREDGAKEGDVILAYNQSYSSYAVVREAYDSDNRALPANSYIAIATTPTTDKSAVTDATYKGQASWSSSNLPSVRTVAGLTMTVSNDKISGEVIQDTATSSGKTPTLITFNSGDITVTDGNVGFNGTATFHSRAFGTDLEGTYQGNFAGEKAEEIIGTFQSNEQTPDAAAQGAFSGQKQ